MKFVLVSSRSRAPESVVGNIMLKFSIDNLISVFRNIILAFSIFNLTRTSWNMGMLRHQELKYKYVNWHDDYSEGYDISVKYEL